MQTETIVGFVTLALITTAAILFYRRFRRDYAAEILQRMEGQKFAWSRTPNRGYDQLTSESLVIQARGDVWGGSYEIIVWPLKDGQPDEYRTLLFLYENFRPISGRLSEEHLQTLVRRMLVAARSPAACDLGHPAFSQGGEGDEA